MNGSLMVSKVALLARRLVCLIVGHRVSYWAVKNMCDLPSYKMCYVAKGTCKRCKAKIEKPFLPRL